MAFRSLSVHVLIAAIVPAAAFSAQPAGSSAEGIDFFEKKIRPVLAAQCYKCHRESEKVKGGLRLDSRAGILQGGETGPALVPGNPEKSLLIQAIRYADDDLQMPPKHRLTPEQVKDFEDWVRLGAPDPREGQAAAGNEFDYTAAKKLWSLQPVRKSGVPAVKDASWPRTDLDRFILSKLEERGLRPNADADRQTLLRRATYDLTGLPPTPEETREFLADSSPDAFARVIERLLASRAYGEKWGRHWLDLVRYADTSGCNSDFPIPSAYRYRNYVVDAFNRDLPYNEFLREQIAGDLLPAASDEERFRKITATGYLAIARRFGSRAKEFHLTLEDLLDNLGKTTLGLSLGCARCHDHKFDPVSIRDYYALYGIFESSRFAFPGTEIYRHTKDFTPLVAEPAAAKFLADAREAAELDDTIENLKNEKKRLAREEEEGAAEPGAKAGDGSAADAKGSFQAKRTAADAERDLDAARARQAALAKTADSVPKAYAVMDGPGRNAAVQKKGDPALKEEEVPRGFLTVLGGQKLPAEERGSGRRQLAEWITDPANPLTARVMVNRIWQHHLGKGLVRTPNDFGVRGEAPTHPELLDWLAERFIASGWSIKSMHRLVMLSRVYALSSGENPTSSGIDPANESIWRFERRRLQAEEVRDSFLAVAGTLDRAPAGPHPFPPEGSWRYTQHKPFIADFPSQKRTIYLLQQRIRKEPFLELFDGPDTNATTAVRPISHTPLQALWLMNAELAHAESMKFAERCIAAFSDEPARISHAFELVLGRPAEPDEIVETQEYLREMTASLNELQFPPEQQAALAFASFGRVLLSSNEFVFLD